MQFLLDLLVQIFGLALNSPFWEEFTILSVAVIATAAILLLSAFFAFIYIIIRYLIYNIKNYLEVLKYE